MERELFALLMAVLDQFPEARRRLPKAQYTHRQVLAVWLWATLHDRPISWAVQRRNWPWHDRTRPLPSGSTVSRRLRDPQVVALIERWVMSANRDAAGPSGPLLMDGKPLPVAGHSRDRDAGVGRTTRAMGRGYKLHAIVDLPGNLHAFRVEPLQVSEQAAAHLMLDALASSSGRTPPWRVLLADGNYDSNKLHDHAAACRLRLRTPRRYRHALGLGHQRHSPHRLASLREIAERPEVLLPRRRIEGIFGTMGNVVGGLSPLPNHVRGLRRVRRWVSAKLLIDAAHRRKRTRRIIA